MRPLLRMIVLNKKPFGKNLPNCTYLPASNRGKETPVTAFEPDWEQLLPLLQRFHTAPADFAFQPHPGPGKLSREHNVFLSGSILTTTCANSVYRCSVSVLVDLHYSCFCNTVVPHFRAYKNTQRLKWQLATDAPGKRIPPGDTAAVFPHRACTCYKFP